MQVFGGVAFTWEHDVHLLTRRALAAERRFGDALHHGRVLSKRIATRRRTAAARAACTAARRSVLLWRSLKPPTGKAAVAHFPRDPVRVAHPTPQAKSS